MNREILLAQLVRLADCAKSAGIWDNTFLGYGSCLGAIREGKPIGHDDDADLCILADKVTKEQEEAFRAAMIAGGLFAHRHKEKRRGDNGRLLWLSCKKDKGGVKTCIWFQQLWKDFYWHSKGDDWVWKIGQKMKPPVTQAQAITKGIPAYLLNPLITIDFCGQGWKIPFKYGACCDYWYPNWAVPAGGASKAQRYCIVKDWKKEDTWIIR